MKALVWPVATYDCESWTPRKNEETRLNALSAYIAWKSCLVGVLLLLCTLCVSSRRINTNQYDMMRYERAEKDSAAFADSNENK